MLFDVVVPLAANSGKRYQPIMTRMMKKGSTAHEQTSMTSKITCDQLSHQVSVRIVPLASCLAALSD